MDNLSVHKNKNKWLAGKRKFHVYPAPTYSSWLNQIEIWFSILTRKILKDGVWHSKEQLVDQLMSYIKTYNEEKAHPLQVDLWKRILDGLTGNSTSLNGTFKLYLSGSDLERKNPICYCSV